MRVLLIPFRELDVWFGYLFPGWRFAYPGLALSFPFRELLQMHQSVPEIRNAEKADGIKLIFKLRKD